MAGYSPPTLSGVQVAATTVVVILSVVYSVLIAAQLLLSIIPIVFVLILYIVWRFLKATEAIADAVQRIADGQQDGI